jgi:hypothetical protein
LAMMMADSSTMERGAAVDFGSFMVVASLSTRSIENKCRV